MKKILLFLLIACSLSGIAQTNSNTKTKTVTLTPQQTAALKAKIQSAYPNAKSTPTKPAISGPKSSSSSSSAASAPNKPKPPVRSADSASTGTNVNAKPFPFLGSFMLNYVQKDAKKSSSGKIKYAFDGFQGAIVPNFQNMKDISSIRSVLDKQQEEMTMLTIDTKGKKNGLLMKMPKPVIKTADTKNAPKPPVIKKTGETKVIQGFKCEKIVALLSDSTKIESWVTIEVPINMSDIIAMTNQSFKGKSPFSDINMKDIKGAVLDALITDKDGKSTQLTITDIKKVKPEATLFNSDGYTIRDVRGLPMFGGQ